MGKPMLRQRNSLAVIAVLALAPAIASAQNDPPPNYDLVNYGREWKSLSDASRSLYLEGFMDGFSATYRAVFNDLSGERRESLRLETAVLFERDAIRDVMKSLYSDPANTYIRYNSMVYIARDKLGGKDIDKTLRDARKNDHGFVHK
jgi:hypothetical protein